MSVGDWSYFDSPHQIFQKHNEKLSLKWIKTPSILGNKISSGKATILKSGTTKIGGSKWLALNNPDVNV